MNSMFANRVDNKPESYILRHKNVDEYIYVVNNCYNVFVQYYIDNIVYIFETYPLTIICTLSIGYVISLDFCDAHEGYKAFKNLLKLYRMFCNDI